MVEHVRKYFGIRPWRRHSLVLLVAGAAYILIGSSYIFTEPTPGRNLALEVALKWLPIDFWGFLFILAGILAIISSRWPPFTETWGYMVLAGLSAGWGAVYGTGVLFGNSPASNLSATLLWGLLGFMWWAISGLLNSDKSAVTHNGRT